MRTARPDRPLRFRVQFTASQEYIDLLEEAFELPGFRRSASSLPEVQLRALRDLVERLRKQKLGARTQPERKSTAPARVAGRHVPVAVSRAVWTRDGSQCAYVDHRGRRCAERRGLELHHRRAYARGGPPTEQNLELR